MNAPTLPLRLRARLAGIAAALLLAGCGSSGGNDEPPPEPLRSNPHPLQASQPEAAALAEKVAESALAGLRVFRDLDSLEEIGRLTRVIAPLVQAAAEAGEPTDIDCGRNPLRLAPLFCSGSMSIRSNQDGLGEIIPAGTFFELRFDRFQLLTPDFERLRISGDVTITYLSDFDTRAERGTLTYRSGGLSTNTDGSILDPSEGALTVNYSDTGIVVESASERFIGLAAAAAGDADGTLSSGAIQTNFGTGFIEIRYSGWTIQAGVAQPPSSAAVAGAAGTSAHMAVTAAGAAGATCQVDFLEAGASRSFDVDVPGG
jgi:hypothetical protein